MLAGLTFDNQTVGMTFLARWPIARSRFFTQAGERDGSDKCPSVADLRNEGGAPEA